MSPSTETRDASVEIVEVSARDGLQSDPTHLPTSAKVELITRAVRAGLRRVEAVSFVNPRRVPQMADAEEVMAALLADDETRALGASYIGLVLNARGLDRAVATGVDEVNAVAVATATASEPAIRTNVPSRIGIPFSRLRSS